MKPFLSISPMMILCSSGMDFQLSVQNFENEYLTPGSGANVAAVTKEFYIFKFWQENLSRRNPSFFSNSTNLVYIEHKTTHTKM